jgi:hypothetical protein
MELKFDKKIDGVWHKIECWTIYHPHSLGAADYDVQFRVFDDTGENITPILSQETLMDVDYECHEEIKWALAYDRD